MTPQNFVAWLLPSARRQADMAPEFLIAQAALESGWGERIIGRYNLFGITRGSRYDGPAVLVTTTEYHSSPSVVYAKPEKVLSVTALIGGRYRYRVKRLFRDYASLDECLADHKRVLMQPCFAHAWPYRHCAEDFAERLQSGLRKYATSPDYVDAMCSIIRRVRRLEADA
jgi:flagellum-specific peptidoglycan hydrolase FlgJ